MYIQAISINNYTISETGDRDLSKLQQQLGEILVNSKWHLITQIKITEAILQCYQFILQFRQVTDLSLT